MQKSTKFNQKLAITGTLASLLFISQPIVLANQAQAAEYNHFASDNIRWELRRGPGYNYKIQRWVNSGTPIKILETGDGDWSRIEFRENGTSFTGWIHKAGVQSSPPAITLLDEAIKRATNAEQKLKTLEKDHAELTANFEVTSKENEKLKQENYEQNQEFTQLKEISTKAVELDQSNREMRTLINELESQNTILKQQVSQADDAEKRQWFLFGAGVLLLGLIIGRVFRMPKRRNGSWNDI